MNSTFYNHTNIETPYSKVTEVVRIDFIQTETSTVVTKMVKHNGRNIPIDSQVKPADFDLESALAWCKDNGWTVRRWPGGARAWKYGLEPVRNAAAIIKLRDNIRDKPRPELNGQGWVLDLQFDL